MPLPKPPAKRASLLTQTDFDSQAAPKPGKRSNKTSSSAEPASGAELHLYDSHAEVAAPPVLPPEAAPPVQHHHVKRPAVEPRLRKPRGDGPPKLFVLDTNVLMHDPMSLFRFEEHDIYLPMITLEELDGHKRGMTEVSRNARQVSRELDTLAATIGMRNGSGMTEGLPLSRTGHREAAGKLYFQTNLVNVSLPVGLPQGKADNQILGVVQALREQQPKRDVVLVSKDINMRIKARALGLPAEDYFNDKTLEDGDLLYTGVLQLPPDFWERHGKTMESWNQGGLTYYRISGPLVPALLINQFVFFEAPGAAPLYAKVTEITGKTAVLRTLREYTHNKNAVWGVTARNREQNFALNLLMDPECDFITLTGTAGTGKTLMTLAAGLSQVMDDRRYTEIIVTRVTVPVGEDIGFLPGTEEEKMGPWMGALDDNLEVLSKSDGGAGEWGRAATNDLVRSKIKIKSLNFMRGRTFLNKYVIIDEAQNLTPKQMKTLITRAGPGTKIVCLGNLAQIDTPYLTEGSSGLTYAVDRFKGWPHSGHIMLARGERSRLADFASEVL
ncbi:PhoH family protein [Piscinibacter sp. XHJ-5]|uniref:PhoH family protein n=1 Tax=Piscinibacter sp. XHJ-5 TaxID=3037797 RepID=UPI0024533224|nr:PhoH family protein [Piscinibacter sp. XHJ-5]